jgi:PTH1 family peptidyl-tRNA hydrolase
MNPFARAQARRGTPADLLVIGLGNPGADYAHTRHNAGADTVALLAERHGGKLSPSKEHALTAELRIRDKRLAVAFPTTYYNEAGRAAVKLVQRHGIEFVDQIVVVHDELDLPLGRLKLKAHLHSDEFLRVRIGVGKPPSTQEGKDHVLRRPGKKEREELDIVIQEAADAVELILSDGIDTAMQRYNQRA